MTPAPESAVKEEQTGTPNPWQRAAGIVFLGFRVAWRPRLSDWDMNLGHAERWEAQFAVWKITGREISLAVPDKGYFVRLLDGLADFRCESHEAFSLALTQASEVVGTLAKERHRRAVTLMETQFLVPWASSFESLVTVLDKKLLKPDILAAVGARLDDCAYLVDTHIDGIYYQLNIGPLRAHETERRLATQTLAKYPDVSLFVSIATRKPFPYEFDDLAAYVDQTIGVGNTVIRELQA